MDVSTPLHSSLPVSDSIDWNDIPDTWIGTGGPERTAWLSFPVYSGVSSLSTDCNWENYMENGCSYNIITDILAGLQAQFNAWFSSQIDRLKVMDDSLKKYLPPEVLDCDILDINISISPSHTMDGN